MKVVWMTPEEYCVNSPRWGIDYGTTVQFQPRFANKQEAELYIEFLKNKPIQKRIKEVLKPYAIKYGVIHKLDYDITPEESNYYSFYVPHDWDKYMDKEREILIEEFEIYKENRFIK